MTFFRSFLYTLLAVLLVIASFGAGYLFRQQNSDGHSYALLQEVQDILANHGLKAVPAEPGLEYGMIRGMLQAYNDPFTYFNEPAQFELTSQNLEGKFGGIGVTLGRDAENIPVLHPIAEGPAAKAGVLDGDRLVQVDKLTINESTP